MSTYEDERHIMKANIKVTEDNRIIVDDTESDSFDVIYAREIYRVSLCPSTIPGRKIVFIKYKTTEQQLSLPEAAAVRLYDIIKNNVRLV